MGNNPSTSSKPATPVREGSNASSHHHRKHPMQPVPGQRIAAPEQTLTQAHGSTTGPSSAASSVSSSQRPKSMPPRGYTGSPAGSSHNGAGGGSAAAAALTAAAATRPMDVRHPTPTPRPIPVPVPAPAPGAEATLSPSAATHAAVAAWAEQQPTQPMAVPHSQPDPPTSPLSPGDDDIMGSALGRASAQDISYLTRPPRLPLPIDAELQTPGSPIVPPADSGRASDVPDLDSDGGLTRKSSQLSNETVEEDEVEELPHDKTRPTVPYTLEWHRGGDKVYVTGTIFQWNRKHRLHPVEGKPGHFSVTVPVLPGTHHVRFLVDGQMQTSLDLPTTVDFGNNLVNYIEVSADDVPPQDIEGSAASQAGEGDDRQIQDRSSSHISEASRMSRTKPATSLSDMNDVVPTYLVDIDEPDTSPQYLFSLDLCQKLPAPPSLPGFLGRPIMNAAILMKDDNSVLNMPNHTVLNHLATGSIKNGVLGVSATTRYKSKYVTTIFYGPVEAKKSRS